MNPVHLSVNRMNRPLQVILNNSSILLRVAQRIRLLSMDKNRYSSLLVMLSSRLKLLHSRK